MEVRYISITQICESHQIEPQFIHQLHREGLVEIQQVDNQEVLTEDEVIAVERMIRLHYQLEINIQGIEAITHLLGQVHELQHEVQSLRSRLKRYED